MNFTVILLLLYFIFSNCVFKVLSTILIMKLITSSKWAESALLAINLISF